MRSVHAPPLVCAFFVTLPVPHRHRGQFPHNFVKLQPSKSVTAAMKKTNSSFGTEAPAAAAPISDANAARPPPMCVSY